LFAWPIPIKLDPVVIGIAQIKRFAHAVIGGALERTVGGNHTPQRVGDRGAGRIEQGEMIQPGGARRRRIAAAAFPGIEPDMVVITPAEMNAACVPRRCINWKPSTPQ